MATDFRSEYLLHLSTAIVRRGFALVPVGFGDCSVPGCDCGDDDGDAWAYTVGLAEHGLSELVVLGLAPVHALQLANAVYDEHLAGRPLVEGEARLVLGVPVRLEPVSHEWLAHDPSRMSFWIQHYRPGRRHLNAPPIAQLVWGDALGRFPGEDGCDPVVAAAQPPAGRGSVQLPGPSAPRPAPGPPPAQPGGLSRTALDRAPARRVDELVPEFLAGGSAMPTRPLIDRFVALQHVAVVGVSRHPKAFANSGYRKLRVGRHLVPVNESAGPKLIEGDAAAASLADVPDPLEGVLVMVPPDRLMDTLVEVAERRVPMVWIHRGLGQPPVPEAAVRFCHDHEIEVIDGACPLMFAEPVGGFHRLHRRCASRRIVAQG